MDTAAVLAAFDEQIRRNPPPDGLDGRVERDGGVVRCVSAGDGWNGVTWSDLDPEGADAAIAAQIDRFAQIPRRWEWKHYSYDRPADLPERLVAAGLAREPDESVLVAEVAALALDVPPPDGVELRAVVDQGGVDALVSVHEQVFGGDHSRLGRTFLAGLEMRPAPVAAVVAFAGPTAIAAGRVELPAGADFAGLWGGGTLPAWRHRGVFRALVARRAALAAGAGFRYVHVDASAQSRPILERLGFVALATTTPFTYAGTGGRP